MARNDYTLAVFDANGQERKDENGDTGSQKVLAQLEKGDVTDVFIMSHGWMGDIPSALNQYNDWTDAMLACTADIAGLASMRPGFKPLMLGFHWPSLPWGDEKVVASFALNMLSPAFDPVADYTARLGGTPEISDAVQRIFAEVQAAANPNVMSPQLAQAYLDLNAALNMNAEGAGAEPGADRLPFDPNEVLGAARTASDHTTSFGTFGIGGLLAPLRTLSFWSMKGRARKIGETAGVNLLRSLQQAANGRDVQFHLMGHSFGCIVVSSMTAGPRNDAAAADPIQSLVLVQGALSLWSYAQAIPQLPQVPGYYHPILSKKITGPIVTTQSQFDRAVGLFYPIAAGIAGQANFGSLEFPLFGGVGTFGIQGVDHAIGLTSMLGVPQQYGFQAGQVYNINSDNVIRVGGGFAGAHGDINHPEVGHVIWQAAISAAAGAPSVATARA